jgi:ABC-type nitrate/sulfonate/bicarbonate transport system permease component
VSAMHSGQGKQFNNNVLWAVFGIGLVIIWLLLWEWSVRFGLSRQFVVPPSELIVLLYQSLFVSGELRPHLWATVTRLIGGFVIGAVPALWLGFIMGRNKRARLRYSPIFTVLGLIPMLSALPGFIIWFGVRDFGKWAIVSAAVFYPILYCTTKGVRISQRLRDKGSSPGVWTKPSDWAYTAGPWIFTGLKLGSIIGVATLLGAELYTSTSGLQFEVLVAGASFQMARAYTAMFTAAFLVYAIWLCLTLIEFALARRYTRNQSASAGEVPIHNTPVL